MHLDECRDDRRSGQVDTARAWRHLYLPAAANGSEAIRAGDGLRELVVLSQKSGTDRVLVAVRDSGAGIDHQNVNRIFDAFFTTKSTGMGMGLAISRSIIEAHGGRIWAEPNDGRGLTVQFILPAETETH